MPLVLSIGELATDHVFWIPRSICKHHVSLEIARITQRQGGIKLGVQLYWELWKKLEHLRKVHDTRNIKESQEKAHKVANMPLKSEYSVPSATSPLRLRKLPHVTITNASNKPVSSPESKSNPSSPSKPSPSKAPATSPIEANLPPHLLLLANTETFDQWIQSDLVFKRLGDMYRKEHNWTFAAEWYGMAAEIAIHENQSLPSELPPPNSARSVSRSTLNTPRSTVTTARTPRKGYVDQDRNSVEVLNHNIHRYSDQFCTDPEDSFRELSVLCAEEEMNDMHYFKISTDQQDLALGYVLDRCNCLVEMGAFNQAEALAHICYKIMPYDTMVTGRAAKCCRPEIPENKTLLDAAVRIERSVRFVQKTLWRKVLLRRKLDKIALNGTATKISAFIRMILTRNRTIGDRLSAIPIKYIWTLIRKVLPVSLKTGRQSIRDWLEIWNSSAVMVQTMIRKWRCRRFFKLFFSGVKALKRIYFGQCIRCRLQKVVEKMQEELDFATEPFGQVESSLSGAPRKHTVVKDAWGADSIGVFESVAEDEASDVVDVSSDIKLYIHAGVVDISSGISSAIGSDTMELRTPDRSCITYGDLDKVETNSRALGLDTFRMSTVFPPSPTRSMITQDSYQFDSVGEAEFPMDSSLISLGDSAKYPPASPQSFRTLKSTDVDYNATMDDPSVLTMRTKKYRRSAAVAPAHELSSEDGNPTSSKLAMMSQNNDCTNLGSAWFDSSALSQKPSDNRTHCAVQHNTSIMSFAEQQSPCITLISYTSMREESSLQWIPFSILPDSAILRLVSSNTRTLGITSPSFTMNDAKRLARVVKACKRKFDVQQLQQFGPENTASFEKMQRTTVPRELPWYSLTSLIIYGTKMNYSGLKTLLDLGIYQFETLTLGHVGINYRIGAYLGELLKSSSTIAPAKKVPQFKTVAKQSDAQVPSFTTTFLTSNELEEVAGDEVRAFEDPGDVVIVDPELHDGLVVLPNNTYRYNASLLSSGRQNEDPTQHTRRKVLTLTQIEKIPNYEFKPPPMLTKLYIENELNLGDRGVIPLFQALVYNTSLRIISIRNCNITARAVSQAIGHYLTLSDSLEVLNLNDNNLDAESCVSIVRAIANKGTKGYLREVWCKHQYPLFTTEECLDIFAVGLMLVGVKVDAESISATQATQMEMMSGVDMDETENMTRSKVLSDYSDDQAAAFASQRDMTADYLVHTSKTVYI